MGVPGAQDRAEQLIRIQQNAIFHFQTKWGLKGIIKAKIFTIWVWVALTSHRCCDLDLDFEVALDVFFVLFFLFS